MADIGWDFDGGAVENLNGQLGVDLRKITEDMQSLNTNYCLLYTSPSPRDS